MSVGADEEPWDDEEDVDVNLSLMSHFVRSHRYYKCGVKLACGDVIWGTITAPEIFAPGWHLATCKEHGESYIVDLVSTKPLTDRWGRT